MAKKKARESKALVRRNAQTIAAVETPGVLGVFERLAKDPRLTVEKLGELIGLQERIMAADAKAAFESAFARMKPELPRISKRGQIKNREGAVQSRYAKYEDIRDVVDPICRRNGFELSYRTEWPETGTLEVIGVLTHERGHSRESRFRTVADASGGKNAIQGLGSGVSYGKRYTTTDLLALVFEGQDDDGKAHGNSFQKDKAADRSTPAPPPVAHQTQSKDPISDKQRRRMFTILSRVHRREDELRAWLERRYRITSTKDIPRDLYDEICAAIEAPGVLPDRQPGEE